MAGRKPKPTQTKIIQGTFRKDRALPDEPTPEIEIPEPPDFLNKDALKEYKEISQDLYKLGLLTKIDRSSLCAYCVAYSRWAMAERELNKLGGELLIITPNGMAQQNALVGIANRAMEIMGKFLSEFGMSPASRTRVSAKKQEAADSGGFSKRA